MNIAKLSYQLTFPDPRDADETGIVAYGGDLSPSRLIRAYQNGIFPWYAKGDPILWWSPDPRFILELSDFKLRPSLKKRMKHFTYKFDEAFVDVVTECSKVPREGQNGTWIQPEIIEAYNVLYGMGKAHSVEAYQDGKLVGGAYGVVVGGVFCGESMFARVNDASKAAFAVLVEHLKEWGYSFIDCQVPTPHLASLGAKEVARDYFLMRLQNVVFEEINHEWRVK